MILHPSGTIEFNKCSEPLGAHSFGVVMAEDLPTLDTDGWVSDPNQKANRLMGYFFCSDYTQTNAHLGKVQSLPWIIKNNQRNYMDLGDAVRRALYTLFSNYFDSVECNVRVVQITNALGDTAKYDIQVNMTYTQDGQTYNLAKSLSIVNNTLKSVSDLANG